MARPVISKATLDRVAPILGRMVDQRRARLATESARRGGDSPAAEPVVGDPRGASSKDAAA